jgi:DNA-binding transcriptional LysR family regulator
MDELISGMEKRRLPPLGSLRAFEAAARHLSFKKAAEELAVTPTAVSHQIRLLEDTLGITLFRRQTRRVLLTEPGQRLFPVLRDGFDAFSEALADISAQRSKPSVDSLEVVFRIDNERQAAGTRYAPAVPAWSQYPGLRHLVS